MSPATASLKQAVLDAMPESPGWATVKQIYHRMDRGSYNTLRCALNELAEAGVVARFGPIEQPCYRFIVPGHPVDKKIIVAMREHRKNLAEWKAR